MIEMHNIYPWQTFNGEYLDPVIILVRNDEATPRVNLHAGRLVELTVSPALHSEHAVDLAARGEDADPVVGPIRNND